MMIWCLAFGGTALLISASTMLVKQHSAVDVFWAYVLCGAAYLAVYVLPEKIQKRGGRRQWKKAEII
ncbi:MAG: hypothetical protein LUJ09_03020 [Firmicutes bacterium]|nr:hypothetical protein [Bacillota bacterium]